MAGHLREGPASPSPLVGECWGGTHVALRPRPPTSRPAPRQSIHISAWHAESGGESGRFSASGTHTIICNGFGRGRQGLNWDFSWPATAELFLRYWAAYTFWQGQVISFFLKCILPSLCQSVNKSHQWKAGVGNYISKLQQAPQGKSY